MLFAMLNCDWEFKCIKILKRNSLVVQWLGLGAFTAEGPGLILNWGTKILQVMKHGQTNK